MNQSQRKQLIEAIREQRVDDAMVLVDNIEYRIRRDASDVLDLRDGEATVSLWYPRNEDSRCHTVIVELVDVRAADDIRIRYDFERNGWAIERPTRDGWIEKSFIES